MSLYMPYWPVNVIYTCFETIYLLLSPYPELEAFPWGLCACLGCRLFTDWAHSSKEDFHDESDVASQGDIETRWRMGEQENPSKNIKSTLFVCFHIEVLVVYK